MSISTAALSPDGSLAIAGYGIGKSSQPVPEAGQKVKVWDATTGKRLHTLQGDREGIVFVAFLPDGNRAISVGKTDIVMWDARAGMQLWTTKARSPRVRFAVLSPDGRRLLTFGEPEGGDRTHHLNLWATADGKLIKTFGDLNIHRIQFLPDSRRILITTENEPELRIVDVDTEKVLLSFPSDRRSIPFAFTPDRKYAVSDKWYNDPVQKAYLVLWDVATGNEVKRFEDRSRPEQPVDPNRSGWTFIGVFTPDGKRLLTWDSDSFLRTWDVARGKQVSAISVEYLIPGPRKGNLRAALEGEIRAFSADTRLALVGRVDCELELWDAEKGSIVRAFNHRD